MCHFSRHNSYTNSIAPKSNMPKLNPQDKSLLNTSVKLINYSGSKCNNVSGVKNISNCRSELHNNASISNNKKVQYYYFGAELLPKISLKLNNKNATFFEWYKPYTLSQYKKLMLKYKSNRLGGLGLNKNNAEFRKEEKKNSLRKNYSFDLCRKVVKRYQAKLREEYSDYLKNNCEYLKTLVDKIDDESHKNDIQNVRQLKGEKVKEIDIGEEYDKKMSDYIRKKNREEYIKKIIDLKNSLL